jgi:hypothetical protein
VNPAVGHGVDDENMTGHEGSSNTSRVKTLLTNSLPLLVNKEFGKYLKMALSQDGAEQIALKAIVWLAGDDELLPVFMGSTGADEAAFREGVADPEFQASVLDFIMMDDAWVVRFCDTEAIPYDRLMQARAALPGGSQVHWT